MSGLHSASMSMSGSQMIMFAGVYTRRNDYYIESNSIWMNEEYHLAIRRRLHSPWQVQSSVYSEERWCGLHTSLMFSPQSISVDQRRISKNFLRPIVGLISDADGYMHNSTLTEACYSLMIYGPVFCMDKRCEGISKSARMQFKGWYRAPRKRNALKQLQAKQ